jgi:hypothetical protein
MQSVAFHIVEAVGAQLKAIAVAQGVRHLDNPAMPLNLRNLAEKRERAIFWLQVADRLQKDQGRRDERSLRVLVGAVAFTDDGRADADALHLMARAAMKRIDWRNAIRAQLQAGEIVRKAREIEVDGELKSIFTEGAGFVSLFEIEYDQTYPAA